MPKDKNSDKTPKKPDRRLKGTGKEANAAGTKNGNIKRRAEFSAGDNAPVVEIPINDNMRGLYSDDILPIIEAHARAGLNNREIAKAMCIGERTFYEWREKYPQVAHALRKYRGVANILVENALYANAVGFVYQEQQATATGKVVTVKKFKTGDTRAQVFYLTNRMPETWKNKVETTIGITQDISQMVFAIKRREE